MAATKIGTAATSQAQPTAISRTIDGSSRVYSWEGDYATLATQELTYTIDVTTIDGLTVRSTSLEPLPGGLARLTVNADNVVAGGTGTNDPVYELEWQRVDQDIRTHPAFKTGAYALTSADRDDVKAWADDSNAATRAVKYTALSANAKQLADRLDKGETHYPLFIPVARKSSYSTSRPISGNCGKQSTPPSQCGAPSGYTYVKMADKVIKRRGGYERAEEWVGFDSIDAMVYPAT